MKTALVVVALMVGCSSDDKAPTAACPDGPVGAYVIEMCGEQPLAPGWSVSTANGSASLSETDWNAVVKWRDDVTAWNDCVKGL